MKKILAIVGMLVCIWGTGLALFPAGVYAGGESESSDCAPTFLGFRPWYYGLTDSSCNIITPDQEDGVTIEVFIWTIVLNIVGILFCIIGYLTIGYLIYGAYLYVLARGDVGRITKAKKTVIRAIIGLVICIMATVFSGLLVSIITSAVGASA